MANALLVQLQDDLQAKRPLRLPTDPTHVLILFEKAKEAIVAALAANDTAHADQIGALAESIAQQTGHPEHQALADWCMGLALLSRAPRPALDHHARALAYYRQAGRSVEQGRLLIGYAGLLGQLGQLAEAATAIDQAEQFLSSEPAFADRLALIALNRADIVGRLGRPGEMHRAAAEAAQRAAAYQRPFVQAQALINRAAAELRLGEPSQAEQTLHEARQLAQAHDFAELGARAAWNLARLCLDHDRLSETLELLADARTDFLRAGLEIDLAIVDLAEARLFERLAMPREARVAARRAIDAFAAADLPAETVEAALFAARLALHLGVPSEARHDLARAEASLVKHPALAADLEPLVRLCAAQVPFQPTVEDRRQALAQADNAVARLAETRAADAAEGALIAAELASTLEIPAAIERYTLIADQANASGRPATELRARQGLSKLLPTRFARQELRRAATIATELRQAMPLEELKANVLSGHMNLYSRLVDAELRARRPEAARQALFTAKGALWCELAAPRQKPPSDPEWQVLRAEIAYWNDQVRQANSPEMRSHARDARDAAEAQVPRLARRPTSPQTPLPTPDLTAVQMALPPRSLILDFLVCERGLLVCVIGPDGPPIWQRLASTETINGLIGRLTLMLRTIQDSPSTLRRTRNAETQLPAIEQLFAKLSQLLLAPLNLPPDLEAIYISPDGPLHSLPWEALAPLSSLAITLLPSAALLGLRLPKLAATAPLALGAPGDPPLSHLDRELAALVHAWPQTQVINPARSLDLPTHAPPSVLHVAAHGQLQPAAPLLSRIELADGPLLLAETFRLNLHGTLLVTLSACETGTLPERGGSVMALSGAFLAAGARAVIAGRWQVDDETTALMMEQLYAGLARGHSPTWALTAARQYVRESVGAHPFYWAAFQLTQRCPWPSKLSIV